MSQSTQQQSSRNDSNQQSEQRVEFGMPIDDEVGESVEFIDADSTDDLVEAAEEHEGEHEDEPYFDAISGAEQKLAAAMEIISETDAVLVKTHPWFVANECGEQDDNYGRWEPFFVAFPETTHSGQLLFRNLAALSEVAYTLSERDEYQEMAADGEDVENSDFSASEHAQMAEQRAATRYRLDSYSPKAWADASIIQAAIGNSAAVDDALLIGSNEDGKFCGRGSLDDADIAVALDRYVNDEGEHKARIISDPDMKDALKAVNDEHWDDVHVKYKPNVLRWECDLEGLDILVDALLEQDAVGMVAVHRITEEAYATHINEDFGDDIQDYPGHEE